MPTKISYLRNSGLAQVLYYAVFSTWELQGWYFTRRRNAVCRALGTTRAESPTIPHLRGVRAQTQPPGRSTRVISARR